MAYNFRTGKVKMKVHMEHENVTQKVLFGNVVHAVLLSGRNYDIIPENCDCSLQCAYFGFSKQSPLSKRNVVTELNMEKTHLQMMLTDVG
jgi:hypothetical protein